MPTCFHLFVKLKKDQKQWSTGKRNNLFISSFTSAQKHKDQKNHQQGDHNFHIPGDVLPEISHFPE